jgi:GNAT superfamily N-acetyltransferase
MRSPAGATIRIAGLDDLDAAVALLRRQLDEHAIALDDSALVRAVRGLIEQPDVGRVLVAAQDGEAAGVAVLSFLWTLEHGGPAVWLDELYVEPRWRRRGIAQALVDEAARLARERGCIALDLEVEDGHHDATRLYTRLGFTRHRRVRWAKRLG